MKLEFGNFKIVAVDDRNFEVQEKITLTPKIGANKGKEIESWQFRGYQSDLRSALGRLAELQVKDVSDDFAVVIARLDLLKTWIQETVVPAMPVLEKTGKKGRVSSSDTFELTLRK